MRVLPKLLESLVIFLFSRCGRAFSAAWPMAIDGAGGRPYGPPRFTPDNLNSAPFSGGHADRFQWRLTTSWP